MPKVSIIIPVYNVEKYLRQCLISCINQTLNDIEIICVNDGSTDNCPQIINEYAQKDNRIKVINQKNQGLSISRNNGFDIATGEYVLFLDSDDWLDLRVCELAYNQASESNNDFLLFNFYRYRENKEIYEKNVLQCRELSGRNSVNLREIENINYLQAAFVWNKIYKREWLIKNNIKFIKMLWEDLPFTVQTIVHSNSMSIIDKPLLYYRIREGSLTKKITPEGAIKSKDLSLSFILETGNKNLIKIFINYYYTSMILWYDIFSKDKNMKKEYEKLMLESFDKIKNIDFRSNFYKVIIKTKMYMIFKIIRKVYRILKNKK